MSLSHAPASTSTAPAPTVTITVVSCENRHATALAIVMVYYKGVFRGMLRAPNLPPCESGRLTEISASCFDRIDREGYAYTDDALRIMPCPNLGPHEVNATHNYTMVCHPQCVLLYKTSTTYALGFSGKAQVLHVARNAITDAVIGELELWSVLLRVYTRVRTNTGGVPQHEFVRAMHVLSRCDIKDTAWFVTDNEFASPPVLRNNAMPPVDSIDAEWRAARYRGMRLLTLFRPSVGITCVCPNEHWNKEATPGDACKRCGAPMSCRYTAVVYLPPFGTAPCHVDHRLLEWIMGAPASAAHDADELFFTLQHKLYAFKGAVIAPALPLRVRNGNVMPCAKLIAVQ